VEHSCEEAVCDGQLALETPEVLALANIPCKYVNLRRRQFQFKIAVAVMPQAPQQLKEDLQQT